MSMDFDEDYVLGENITDLARGKKPKESVVVSVRLTAQEFYRLDKLCNATDKSMSQLVRDALAAYHVPDARGSSVFGVTVLNSEGTAVSVGPRESTSHSCHPVMAGLTGWNLASGRSTQMPEADAVET